MAIKIKHRNPKTTDFKKDDIVINIEDGSLFYKSTKGLHKVATTSTVTSAVSNIDTSGIEIDIDELVNSFPSMTTEEVQAIVGAMFSNNTETNIDATFDATAGVINLEVPVQTNNDDGEIITGNFYSIGLEDNNGTINALNNSLFLGANHDSSNGVVEEDKASIILNQNTPKIEINGDLEVKTNTANTANGIGVGKVEVDSNLTVGGNIRADRIIVTDSDGFEHYLEVGIFGQLTIEECPDGQCT